MCGIFGVVYGEGGPQSEEWEPIDLMQIMFPAIVHRGEHAYGWMWAQPSGEIFHQKREGRSDTPQAQVEMEAQNISEARWLVCHVRQATKGDPSYMGNNHPIPHGNIIGVHNGTLTDYKDVLKETGREDPKAVVDSEAIFAAVNRWGHKRGLGRIAGPMVAVYADRRHPLTLHFARSEGRPLCYTRTEAGNLLFASEPEVMEITDLPIRDFQQMTKNQLMVVRGGRVRERKTFKPKKLQTALDPNWEVKHPKRPNHYERQWAEELLPDEEFDRLIENGWDEHEYAELLKRLIEEI
jgi:glutamine phosphoribosylpyrophosphate amidotransferase